MTTWTDRDYAQAAIDMLPGTVEEIDEHMRVHGIKNQSSTWRSTSCPVAMWVQRWVGATHVSVGFSGVDTWDFYLGLPLHVTEYIIYADQQVKPL